MNPRNFYDSILGMLQGRTEAIRDIPTERLDWAGPGALLELYRETAGDERDKLIRAMGQVIRDHPASPAMIAQLVQIASGLDIAQVEPEVRNLQEDPFAAEKPLRSAITNYLAFRGLKAAPITRPRVTRRPANGKAKSPIETKVTTALRKPKEFVDDGCNT
jgi:hypothetical protein